MNKKNDVYMRERRKSRRNSLIDIRGGKCEVCGSKENLEFDHRERTTKIFNLSGCHLDKSWDKIIQELEKCDLLCSDCHREHTNEQYKNCEIIPHNKDKGLLATHGTPIKYSRDGCRCELCKIAKKMYRNKEISYLENYKRD